MTEYEKNKWLITNKAIEVANLIKQQEEKVDNIMKVNIYLLRKYKDDLLKDFEFEEFINSCDYSKDLQQELIINEIYDKIVERMNEEMPDPWYCYSFGGTD